MKMTGKRIAITGGASGIGLELVRQLHGDNEVIVLARASSRLEALRAEFPGVEVFEVDLADGAQVVSCAGALVERYDGLDVLINNAAVQYSPAFTDPDFDRDTIAREIAVNLTAPIQLCAAVIPLMGKVSQSAIVNINSGLALVAKRSSAVYCATKGGLNIFSQSLGHQLEGTGISVVQVFLPLVDTAMTAGRGTGKISGERAAAGIIAGIESGKAQVDIGKVKLLRLIQRISPLLAQRIMKSS